MVDFKIVLLSLSLEVGDKDTPEHSLSIIDNNIRRTGNIWNFISETLYIVTPEEVSDTLKSLPICKAAVPYFINNRPLKKLAEPLALSLSDLFNFSRSSGSVPHIWKQANVTPIHKKKRPL